MRYFQQKQHHASLTFRTDDDALPVAEFARYMRDFLADAERAPGEATVKVTTAPNGDVIVYYQSERSGDVEPKAAEWINHGAWSQAGSDLPLARFRMDEDGSVEVLGGIGAG